MSSNSLIRIVATNSEVRSFTSEVDQGIDFVQTSQVEIPDLRLERIKEFLQASNSRAQQSEGLSH